MNLKILHALVGYLAVTAPPFGPFNWHPFAFASPLAASDYDGYVDTTQNHIDGALMKHVLGSIIETCQTVTYNSGYVNTTQNRSDSAFMKRVPGDIQVIEARQADLIGLGIISIVAIVTFSLLLVANDDTVRGNDVESLVEH